MARKTKHKRTASRKRKAKAAPAKAADAAILDDPNEDEPVSVERKIYPRNLTARASYFVPGNPVTTRPEDAVANCFPGLELDVRNLDRRFFPGLVFDFITAAVFDDPEMHYGARLTYVAALEDPELQFDSAATQRLLAKQNIDRKVAQKLFEDLNGDVGDEFAEGDWFLDWIEQKGKRVSVGALDGLTVWRFVRGLEPGPVTIHMRQWDGAKRKRGAKTLHGWRRLYTDPDSGVISDAYQPGELMQGLCSPWQHDFRDCACHYWASNHPDVVLGEIYPGEPTAGGESEKAELNVRLDWLRVDRSRELAAKALNTIRKNRSHQIDHYEINRGWQEANIVLGGREIGDVYLPEMMQEANPYAKPDDLAKEIREWLAPLELTLIFEYLYARFSLLTPEEAQPGGGPLADAVTFARQELMMVAASEMHHLRWANEILWELSKAHLVSSDFAPIIKPSELIPVGPRRLDAAKAALNLGNVADPAEKKSKQLAAALASYVNAERKREFRPQGLEQPTRKALAAFQQKKNGDDAGLRARDLRLLTKVTMDDFIAVEHPSSFIDGAYARVVATLNQPKYPPQLVELARRIASEGMEHESRFIAIKGALDPFDEPQYLRMGMKVGTQAQTKKALEQLKIVVDSLTHAYHEAGDLRLQDSSPFINEARTAMTSLLEQGEKLAGTGQGIGIPFFSLWPEPLP